MIASRGFHVRAPLVIATAACWTLTLWAQAGSPSRPAPTPADAEAAQRQRIEQAHEDVRRITDTTARDAARLTHEVAGVADGDPAPGPVPRQTFIDRLLFDRIERDGIPHAGLASDEEFVRRVFLDAIGLPPTPAEVRAFLADTGADKRARLVDALLARDEFTEQWAWFLGDLLRSSGESGPGSQAFHYWLREQLAVDRPYDRFVHDLLTPSAKVHATLPSLALIGRNNQLKSRMVDGPDDYRIHNRLDAVDSLTIDIARVFLGLNISCISCHNGARHLEQVNTYLAKRTRKEFFEQAAFFGTTRMIGNWNDRIKNVERDLQVDDLWKGYDAGDDAPFTTLAESQFPRPRARYEPAFLLTGERPVPGASPRAELARMITAHPQFARATVNLVWGRLMTVGFVEPYDGFDLNRLSGPEAQPTNPELLDAMGLPSQAPDSHDHDVERVPALVAIPRRVGRPLHQLLPAKVRPRDERPGSGGRGRGGDGRADAVHAGGRAGAAREAADGAAGRRSPRRGAGGGLADAELLPEQPPHAGAVGEQAVDAAGAADDAIQRGERPRPGRRAGSRGRAGRLPGPGLRHRRRAVPGHVVARATRRRGAGRRGRGGGGSPARDREPALGAAELGGVSRESLRLWVSGSWVGLDGRRQAGLGYVRADAARPHEPSGTGVRVRAFGL